MPKKPVAEEELVETLVAYVNHKYMSAAGRFVDLTKAGVVLRLDKLEREKGLLLVRSGNPYIKHRVPVLNRRGLRLVEKHGYVYDENVNRWYRDTEGENDNEL